MFKVLVVGCGGSGAQTLAYMMDQLKTTLAENAPVWFEQNGRKLPDAWQFVSIDAPTEPERISAIPNVPQAGGRYISTGADATYPQIDRAISTQLGMNEALGSIATWAYPDPNEVAVPVSKGAGQYRGVGRLLILNKLGEVSTQLAAARDALFSHQANTQLDAIRREMRQGVPQGETAGTPVVFVVSSMAGGAGASMALDVCRILGGLGLGDYESLSALFMVTPDVFTTLGGADNFGGTSANALAMFSELTAGQFGQGSAPDRELYKGLGYHTNVASKLAARIFPVGIAAGANAVRIAPGAKPSTVYRALGRGLAALTTDTQMMQNFQNYNLGNPAGLPFDVEMFGWGLDGAATDSIPWGSFGYGRLAMGRDRYAEYAAQRLASSAVDVLVDGFKFPDSNDSDDEQIEKRLNYAWQSIYNGLWPVLPLQAPGDNTPINQAQFWGDWVRTKFNGQINSWAQGTATALRTNGYIPLPNNQNGAEWLATVNAQLANGYSYSNLVLPGLNGLSTGHGPLYFQVYEWALPEHLQQTFLRVIAKQVSDYGVAFGSRVVRHIRQQLLAVSEVMRNARPLYEGLKVDGETKERITNAKGNIKGDGFVDDIQRDVYAQLWRLASVRTSNVVGEVLKDFADNFLASLLNDLGDAHRNLELDLSKSNDEDLGVAQTKTNVPKLWPSEDIDVVPDRFWNAANEVMITEPGVYMAQFEHDVVQSVISPENPQLRYDEARPLAARHIVSGDWVSEADAEDAPNDLLTLVQPWVPRALTQKPDSGDTRQQTSGKVEVKMRSEHVLDRARKFVARKGYSFQQFVDTSLRSYILRAPNETEKERRRADVASKFGQAMTKALPLAQINADLLQRLYGVKPVYKFNYSTVPLEGDAAMVEMLANVERSYPNASFDQETILGGALSTEGEQREVSIYGSYPNYLPVVFDSILTAAAKQWDATVLPKAREDFWKMRRARPIQAAVPLTGPDRQAMVNGWYVGRLIGSTIFPGNKDRAGDHDAIHVYDPVAKSWKTFDTPLLSPPSAMRTSVDWLPSILESMGMAWAKADKAPVLTSLEPYMALRRNWNAGERPQPVLDATMGYDLLRKWLFDGVRVGGDQAAHLAVTGTEPSATPEERLQAAMDWLQKEGDRAAKLVPSSQLESSLPPGSGRRELADISDREVAMSVPLLSDIALDVCVAVQQIANALQLAHKAGPPEAVVTNDAPILNLGGSESSSGGKAQIAENFNDF